MRMKYSRRLLIGFGITLILIFSSIFFVIHYLSISENQIGIDFIPDELNTIPDDIGWFVAEIESTSPTFDYEIEIQTNVSIETEYQYWPHTPLLEVFIYPNSSHIDLCIEVVASITVGSSIATDSAILNVLNWTAFDLEPVIEMQDVFIEYLEETYPELGINDSVSWTPIFNTAGILIVGHYLFLSDEWEMEVSWHVMIAPHDWVRVYLRYRGNVLPSWAGEISSWSSNRSITEIEPPASIFRPR